MYQYFVRLRCDRHTWHARIFHVMTFQTHLTQQEDSTVYRNCFINSKAQRNHSTHICQQHAPLSIMQNTQSSKGPSTSYSTSSHHPTLSSSPGTRETSTIQAHGSLLNRSTKKIFQRSVGSLINGTPANFHSAAGSVICTQARNGRPLAALSET